ncbi:kelch-like protein [Pimephales promelas]|nr:kelch-like protein [Pimephales promelas]
MDLTGFQSKADSDICSSSFHLLSRAFTISLHGQTKEMEKPCDPDYVYVQGYFWLFDTMAMDLCLQRKWRSSWRTDREDENTNFGNRWMDVSEEQEDPENPVAEHERSEDEERKVQAYETASVSTDDIGDSEKYSTFRGLTFRDEEHQMTDSSDEYDGHCSFEDCDDCDMKLYSDPANPRAIFEALENMMLNSVLNDLTICTEDGHQLQVHSIVLAAVSNLIQKRLRQKPKQERIITLRLGPEVHGSGLAAVVAFAYTGNISILNKAHMELVRTAAVSLEAPRVLEICTEEEQREQDESIGKKPAEEHMNDSLQHIRQLWTQRVGCDVELEAEGRVFHEAYGMSDLLALANNFVLKHFQDVSITPKFHDLPVDQFMKYLQSDSLNVLSELPVFKAVMSWIEACPNQRLKLATELMGTIRFPLMTFKEFNEVMSVTSLARIGAKHVYKSFFQEFFSGSSDVQSNIRVYMPKDTIVIVGGERMTDDCDKHTPCREMWFSNSLQNHVGLVKKVEWKMLGTLPKKPRFNHGVGAIKGKLYVVGGRHYYGTADTMKCTYMYDPIQNSWQRLADMHERRGSFTLVVLNDKLYAIGGERYSGVNMESVEVYCPNTNSWSFVRPLDQALCLHAASVWNGSIFLSGGLNGQYHCQSSMILYHPERGSTYLAEMGIDRALHCMETLGDQLYVFGGVSSETDGHLVNQLGCEVYDPVANSWSAIMPFPVPHVGSASAVLEGKVYVIGGYCHDSYKDVKFVHRYDPATAQWENMSTTPGQSSYTAACVLPIPIHLRKWNPGCSGYKGLQSSRSEQPDWLTFDQNSVNG